MHEYECFVSGFGTFFSYATCMSLFLLQMHVMCMSHAGHIWNYSIFIIHGTSMYCSCYMHVSNYVVHTNMHPNILAMHGTWMYSSARTQYAVTMTVTSMSIQLTLLGFTHLLAIPVYDGNKRKVSQWHTENLSTP